MRRALEEALAVTWKGDRPDARTECRSTRSPRARRATGTWPTRGWRPSIFLALALHRPLLLEGEAGVGKTEVAKVPRPVDGRASCCGCSATRASTSAQAVYEWDYARQLLHLRAAEVRGEARGRGVEDELYCERFLVRRPLLAAIDHRDGPPPVLLIDEVDRADDEFEAFLLEFLSEYAVTVPELGTFRARSRRSWCITSNRTRDVHDALKRRCLYHWVEHPDFEREVAIVPPPGARGRARSWPDRWPAAVEPCGTMELYKPPGVAETIDWAAALAALGCSRARRADRRPHPGRRAQIPGGPGSGAGRGHQ